MIHFCQNSIKYCNRNIRYPMLYYKYIKFNATPTNYSDNVLINSRRRFPLIKTSHHNLV